MAIVTRVCDRYNGSARTAMKRAAKAARLKKRVIILYIKFIYIVLVSKDGILSAPL